MYKVIFMKGERIIGSAPWNKGQNSAKQHALDFLRIINADRVEVRDENDTLVFQHPRTLHTKRP